MATRGSALTNVIWASVSDGVDRAVNGELQGSNMSDGSFKECKWLSKGRIFRGSVGRAGRRRGVELTFKLRGKINEMLKMVPDMALAEESLCQYDRMKILLASQQFPLFATAKQTPICFCWFVPIWLKLLGHSDSCWLSRPERWPPDTSGGPAAALQTQRTFACLTHN